MVCGASGRTFPGFCGAGADPATILGSHPVPDTLSEYAFAGLLRGTKTEVVKCISNDLKCPPVRRLCWKGISNKAKLRRKGRMATTPVTITKSIVFRYFTVTHITQREDAIYHSTYTGRPPDEPAVLRSSTERSVRADSAKTVPEIVDFICRRKAVPYRLARSDDQKNSTPDTRSAS